MSLSQIEVGFEMKIFKHFFEQISEVNFFVENKIKNIFVQKISLKEFIVDFLFE